MVIQLQWIIKAVLIIVLLHQIVFRAIRHLWNFPIPAFATQYIDNPIRRRFLQNPSKIADRLELEQGMNVLEIGPGKGSYTIEVARRIYPGKLYAFDISKEVVDNLIKRLQSNKVTNIDVRVEDVFNLSLEDDSVDRIFMVTCLPEIPNPGEAVTRLVRVLKPGGLFCTCELLFDPDYPLMGTEKRWMDDAGLVPFKEYNYVFSYQLIWKKPM